LSMSINYYSYCSYSKYNKDLCIFLSWMWDKVLSVSVGDVYEIFKQLFRQLEKIPENTIENIIKSVDLKAVNTIEKVVNQILSVDSTKGCDVKNVVMLVPRPPLINEADGKKCKVDVDNRKEPFPAFYIAEKGVSELECGRLVRKFRYGDENPYPLPSWIKGYAREALHKLVFLTLLRTCINELQKLGVEKKKCADILLSYMELISKDDENLVVELLIGGRNVQVLNIVGVLLGTGVNASPLAVYQLDPEECSKVKECVKGCSQEEDEVRCFAFRIDVTRTYFALTFLEQILYGAGEFTHIQSLTQEIRSVLESLDVVVAHLVKASMYVKIAEAQLPQPGFLIFVPFTARIGSLTKYIKRDRTELTEVLRCYESFAESVKVIIPRDRSARLGEILNPLKTLLNLYAEYFIRKAMEAGG